MKNSEFYNKQSIRTETKPFQFSDCERRLGLYSSLIFKVVLILSVISLLSSVFYGFGSKSVNSFNVYIDSVNSSDVIFFDFGKYELKPAGEIILDKIALKMNEDNSLKLNITGHTDDIGSKEFNKKLSVNRAEEVKRYLICKGIDGSRLNTEGMGEEIPLGENTEETGRQKNRRVEFRIISDKSERNLGRDAERQKTKITFAQPTLRNNLSNSVFKVLTREEINAEVFLRDTTGEVVTGIKEEDITAVLKWDIEGKIDSTEGYPRLIAIDDKKKLAFTLTMDYSGSMFDDETGNINAPKTNKIIAMEKSVKKFIEMMESKMYCKIIKFGQKVSVTSGYSKSKYFLNEIIDAGSVPMGSTALYSSIYTALSDTMFQSNPTVMKTVIAFTDGMENSSQRLTIDSIYRKSNEMNTKIYTIGWFNFTGKYIPSNEVLIKGKADLLNIARNSGGFFYNANNAHDLEKIYSNIFKQILNSYNVSIVWNSSKLPPKGTQVKAELKINVNGSTRVLYKNYVME